MICYISILFLLSVLSLFIDTGYSYKEDFLGCHYYKAIVDAPHVVKRDEDCMFEDLDIMPGFYVEKFHTDTAQECKEKCKTSPYCAYYSHVSVKKNSSRTDNWCLLKSPPGYDSTPVMFFRIHSTDTPILYMSGAAKGCKQVCKEEKELVPGCGAATPVTCKFLKSSYREDCLYRTKQISCFQTIFHCCSSRFVRSENDDKKLILADNSQTYVKGRIFDIDDASETLITYKSGVRSAEQCHTLCLLTKRCTDWDYMSSKPTSYIGGACYLRHYDSTSERKTLPAPDNVEASAGLLCHKYGYCINKAAYPKTKPFTADPIPNTCFYKNIDFGNKLNVYYEGITTPEQCQEKCQQYQGCRYFLFRASYCQLSYTNYDFIEDTRFADYIAGPRDCSFTIVDTCLLHDQKFVGEMRKSQYLNTASICAAILHDYNGVGWSYYNETCYIYASIRSTEPAPGYLSAPTRCSLPFET